jgi:aspartyl protease family protein
MRLRTLQHAWFAGWLLAVLFGAMPAQAAPADDKPAPAFAGVYAKLGITLPPEALKDADVLTQLKDLQRRPCDRKIVLSLGEALEKTGYRREAAEGLFNFVKACGGPDEALRRSAEMFLKLPDNDKVLAVADEIVRRAPKNSYAVYLRGTVRDATGDNERALADFASAIELYGRNKKSIPAKLYQAMASSYAKLGRYCEAATPIRIWVSYDPINRDTFDTQKTIADYQESGKCVSAGEAHMERYPLRGHVVAVQAEVNGIRGNFILDTGASYVSVRPGFANRARISQSALNQVMMNTANGQARAILSRADRITVGKLAAINVPVVVLAGGAPAFGPGVDGLLGMSFLSRFDVRMTGGFIEIATRGRR